MLPRFVNVRRLFVADFFENCHPRFRRRILHGPSWRSARHILHSRVWSGGCLDLLSPEASGAGREIPIIWPKNAISPAPAMMCTRNEARGQFTQPSAGG